MNLSRRKRLPKNGEVNRALTASDDDGRTVSELKKKAVAKIAVEELEAMHTGFNDTAPTSS